MINIEIINNGLLYRGSEDDSHFRNAYWATVVELADGELLAAMDICNHMNSVDARSYYSSSNDNGKSWTEPRPIWNDSDWKWPYHTTCRISKTPDDKIVGFMGIKNRSIQGQPHTNPQTGGMVEMTHAIVRWDDSAKKWSKPEIIDRPIDWQCFECCHWIFPVTSQKWLIPTAFRLDWNGQCPFGHKAFAFVSQDAGNSWPEIVDIFDFSPEGLISWELKQTFLSDGRIFAVCWAFDPKTKQNLQNRYTFSDSKGQSYGKVFESPLWGQTCTPIGLNDNHILCIYRRMDKKGLWAHLAKIEKNEWLPIADKLIWGGDVDAIEGSSSIENQKKLQFGFPCVIKLQNSSLFLVFWCVENGLSNIRWYKLNLDI